MTSERTNAALAHKVRRLAHLDLAGAMIAAPTGLTRLVEIGEKRLPPAARRLAQERHCGESGVLDAGALFGKALLVDLTTSEGHVLETV